MIVMALDHTRDYFGTPGANPTDLASTTSLLFFTRWITHFCAPVFFLLTGTGAFLSLPKKSVAELSRFLFTRGLWLISLEVTFLRCLAYQFNFDYRVTLLIVIWALGWSMIALAALVWLPASVVTIFGVVMIVGHNLLDGIRSASPIWAFLHSPGCLVPPPGPVPAPTKPGDKSLDDYLKQAKVWKDRLAQVRKWLDKISSHKDGDKTPDQTAKKPETLQERLKREINESGYTHVQASHLVEGAPRFLLKDLKVLKLRVPYFGKDETVDLVAQNLSTDPNLIPDVPSITINTSKKTLDLLISLAGSSAKGGVNVVNLKYANLSADAFAKNLLGGANVLKGGTIDFETNGTFDPAGVNLPLNVTLNNTAVAGRKLKVLPIKIGVTGPLDSPSLGIDPDAIMKAVASAALGGVTDK